jgi:hypothetical protein
MINDKIIRYEKYFFILVTLLNLIPALNASVFLTLDGPAHLYNASLIKYILLGNEGAITDYFHVNSMQFTNWTGHLMTAFFMLFLPAKFAEKLLIIIILVGLPYAFRRVIMRLTGEKSYLSYLVFPFCWSQLFFHGFFNFFIGIIFLFILLFHWVSPKLILNLRTWVAFFFLFLVISGSHVFVFLLAVMISSGWIIWINLLSMVESKKMQKTMLLIEGLKKLAFLISASMGGFIILIFYLMIPNGFTESVLTHASLLVSLNDIRIIKPLLAISAGEQMFTAKWFYWLILMTLFALIIRIIMFVRKRKRSAVPSGYVALFENSDYFLMISAIFFAMFIIYNLWLEKGFYINSRYLLLAFLFWAGWLAVQRYPRWLAILSLIIALSLNFTLIFTRQPLLKGLNRSGDEFIEIAQDVKPGSIIYPLNFTSNWLFYHAHNYVGAVKPMVMIDNYECDQPFFPLQWNSDKKKVKQTLDASYPDIVDKQSDGKKVFDYLLTFAESEVADQPQYKEFMRLIDQRFKIVAVSPSGSIKLYQPIN